MTRENDARRMQTLGDIARYQARQLGDQIALKFGARQTTYRELDQRSSQIAHALRRQGVRPQARVAILDKNTDHHYALLLGAAKAGCVLVPINWRLSPSEVKYILDDSGAELLFVGAPFATMVETMRGALKTVRNCILMGDEHGDELGFADWYKDAPGEDPQGETDPTSVVIQLYTSGTTGSPKGAQLSHRNLLEITRCAVNGKAVWPAWGTGQVNLIAMPTFHIAGTGFGITALVHGATSVIMSEFEPIELLDLIEREGVTCCFLVPAAIRLTLQVPDVATRDFSRLKCMIYGASPMPIDLLRRAIEVFQCGFVQLYGLTETSGGITFLPPEDHNLADPGHMSSAGRPFDGVEIRILDEQGNPVLDETVGEVAIRSPMNMIGYWNLPEATSKALSDDGWFKSGDVGYLKSDGYLYIYDRVKDMIISGGENIYPAEVESAIFGHPAVADVAVIGVPSEKWGEEVKAIVVRHDGADVTPEDIIAHARSRIAAFKVPKSVDFIDALPRNPSGKLLKRELRKPYWEGQTKQVS